MFITVAGPPQGNKAPFLCFSKHPQCFISEFIETKSCPQPSHPLNASCSRTPLAALPLPAIVLRFPVAEVKGKRVSQFFRGRSGGGGGAGRVLAGAQPARSTVRETPDEGFLMPRHSYFSSSSSFLDVVSLHSVSPRWPPRLAL